MCWLLRLAMLVGSGCETPCSQRCEIEHLVSGCLEDFGTHSDTHRDTVYIQTIPVKTQRVDTWIKTLDVDNTIYNAANIDVQGYELQVLKGMSSCLSRLKVIELEVNTEEVYKGCALIHEIDYYLSHYEFRRVYVNMWGQGYGSALYINPIYLIY